MFDLTMAKHARPPTRRSGYKQPTDIRTAWLSEVLATSGRGALKDKQMDLLSPSDHGSGKRDVRLHFAGDLSLVDKPCIAIVGSRSVSDEGAARARRLARELVEGGLVVVSGLALGVDTAAHLACLDRGGSTIAVIGTPLDKAYPAENAPLQEEIYADHLLLSPFAVGERTFRSSFPKRNRVMAALTDATVIIEASDTSGSLHQAAECVRLGRRLFIAKSLVDNPALEWPKKFVADPHTEILTATSALIDRVIADRH